MIYLVSNVHRSGSSMLMRCLEAGGLTPVFNKQADSMNKSAPLGYIPNPNGFYQFTNIISNRFIHLYENKLIKCPIRYLLKLPEGEYKLAFIKRNPKEIRASMKKWTPYQSWGKDEVLTYLYNEYVDEVLFQISKRKDIDITVLNYFDIVIDPVGELSKLSFWNIDVNKAALVVDESLYRLRLTNNLK